MKYWISIEWHLSIEPCMVSRRGRNLRFRLWNQGNWIVKVVNRVKGQTYNLRTQLKTIDLTGWCTKNKHIYIYQEDMMGKHIKLNLNFKQMWYNFLLVLNKLLLTKWTTTCISYWRPYRSKAFKGRWNIQMIIVTCTKFQIIHKLFKWLSVPSRRKLYQCR